MLLLDPNIIGLNRGWISVAFVDDPKHPDFGKVPFIRTLDQFYTPDEGWRTGSFFTSERLPYNGRVPYRRPISFAAKLRAIFPGWFIKVWRHGMERLRKPVVE